MKKLLLSLFLGGLLLSTASAASGVTTENTTIAGKKADLVYFQMGNGRTGEIRTAFQGAVGDQNVGDMIAAAKKQGGKTLVAAINGGYFNSYYNPKKTLSFPENAAVIYAAVMQNGNVLLGGGKKPTLGFTTEGKPLIDWVDIKTTVRIRGSQDVTVWGVNTFYADASAVLYFTPAMHMSVPIPKSAKIFHIVNGVITKVTGGGTTKVPANTQLLVYNQTAYANAVKYNMEPQLGNSAAFLNPTLVPTVTADAAAWGKVTNLVSSGPMILLNGTDVTGQNPDFSGKQGPDSVGARSFAAIMGDGRLVFGTATASMRQLATALKAKGAQDVISLDGGASSMLYVEGTGYVRSAGRKLSNIITIVDYANGALPKPAIPKADVASTWATDSIASLSAEGILPDGLSSQFRANITRQEFAKLIMKLIEAKSTKSRKDLILATGIAYDGIKYSDAYDIDVIDASRLGIMDGIGGGKFSPNGSITREQAATIIKRTATLLGKAAPDQGLPFSDQGQISSWAVDGVTFAAGHGIMTGSGGSFRPKAYYTREEAFVTMTKLIATL